MSATRPTRILHTADWHLNDRLGRVDRQPDILARLDQIARYLDEHQVDILLIAGDLFSIYCRSDALRDSLTAISERFRPFLLRGGTMVAISGNHDHEATFTMLHAALDLASPIERSNGGSRPGGRLYLASKPGYLHLTGKGGQEVQLVLLPYPTPSRYMDGIGSRYNSGEERNRALQQTLRSRLNLIQRDHVKPTLPSVLAAHLHVRGSEVHSLYGISELDDVVFDHTDLPTSWAYAALGHIHKPQTLSGMPHIRYSGSIERLDYAERDDAKGCVLFDVGPTGLVGEPVVLPLDSCPIYKLVITDPATELAGLRERYPDCERALVKIEVHWKPGEHNLGEIHRELETIFPRWTHRDPVMIGQNPAITGQTSSIGTLRDVRGTTTAWIEEQLADDPDREELVALALTFIDDEEVVE